MGHDGGDGVVGHGAQQLVGDLTVLAGTSSLRRCHHSHRIGQSSHPEKRSSKERT